ncbi:MULTISPECIES: ATP-binding cassette domain-containing protein [Clostridia]|uniref:ABC transporter ATP-binding protein n=1 Tax=Clostridium saudiense TaxID=1414720 RepID=A0ABS2FJW4_9CLOT|nr:ABC transporter ATP-binding protein [Paraclostridium bifermentans]MBM6820880.1 ABC transporter ATP-binding protein [Clostridium saudiense]
MREVIKTNNLVKKYGENIVLDNISIKVNQGEIYGLVGDNGAGKTTLFRILSGQSNISDGSFELLGESSEKNIMKVRKRIGTIIENPSFYPKMTIEENLEYYRLQRGIPGKKNIDKILKEVGLLEVKKKKFNNISLGMKQRLGLALALLGEPELLILDEPINGLDPSGIIEIRNLLLKLNREKNITIIISSHILSELYNIATCYGFLSKGKLVEELSLEQLNERCRSYLEINVTNPKKFSVLLEEKLGYKNYKIMPDGLIHLFEKDPINEEISRLAVENGIGLKSINEKSANLENYYLSLIGGVKNA